jgi:pentatricopeptide repeat protein
MAIVRFVTSKGAFCIFEQMKSRHIRPDHITYNALINGLCKLEIITDAEDLVIEMEKSRVDPSVETFNTLIDAYGRAGHLEKCFTVLSDMHVTCYLFCFGYQGFFARTEKSQKL